MNSPPAFTDQSKTQLSAMNFTDVTHSPKLTGASLPCFSATSYSVLRGNKGMKHQLQQPCQDAPGAAAATVVFATIPVVLIPFFCNFPSPPYISVQLHITSTASPPTPTALLLFLSVLCQELLVLKRGELTTWNTWLPMGQSRTCFLCKGNILLSGKEKGITMDL